MHMVLHQDSMCIFILRESTQRITLLHDCYNSDNAQTMQDAISILRSARVTRIGYKSRQASHCCWRSCFLAM